jgi:hypothetical protein
LAVLAAGGATAADRLGAASPGPATPGTAVSSVWLCPHGGGADWLGTIAIANPGATAIRADISTYTHEGLAKSQAVDVPGSGQVLVEVPAEARSSATLVEVYDGEAAVGWIVRGVGDAAGMGAEPCTATSGARWWVVDGDTTEHVASYVIVMNPFAADAVVDVGLLLPDKPPVRDEEWTDLPVKAGRSIALDLSRKALGEAIVGVEVIASRGEVAIGSLVVRKGTIRSMLGSPVLTSHRVLPVVGGSGGGIVSLLVTTDAGLRYRGTLLSGSLPSTAGNMADLRQGGTSTASNVVTTRGASAIVVDVVGEPHPIAAGLREAGSQTDEGATGGAPAPATAWVVLPAALGADPQASIVVVNDGSSQIMVTATRLGAVEPDAAEIQLDVPAMSAVAVPRSFLDVAPMAAVSLTADGPFYALRAGTVGGEVRRYAMSLGVPMRLPVET